MRYALWVVAALAAVAAPSGAEPSREARAFGARPFVGDISLSPDGGKLAVLRPDGARGQTLSIADFATGGLTPILRASGSPERLNYCRWTTSARLVCNMSVVSFDTPQPLQFTRLIALDADGKNLKMLSQEPSSRATSAMQFGGDIIDWTGDGRGGSVLMMRNYVADNTIGTRLANAKEGNGVDSIDTVTLRRSPVEQPRLGASEYISDGLGRVRIMGVLGDGTGGYMGDHINYSYRKPDSRDWQSLSSYQLGLQSGQGFSPYAVDPQLNVAYGLDDVDGRKALVQVALDGSLTKRVLVARPDVDVDGLIRIGRQQRVVGASWVNETRAFEFFDPELKALAASLGKALPKRPLVRIIDASADEKLLLIEAGADDDAGQLYLYDKNTRKLEPVYPVRPELAGIAMGKMKAVSYRAADGTTIPAYLTLPPGGADKNLSTIVMPHGGPAARDEWGFDWLAQFFASRGYAVLQPNFRGSAGYGASWFQKNGFQSWRTAVGDINDGGKWLVAQGIAAPDRLAAVGWSYGGYAALQSAALDPNLFKAIIAIAPVTDLDTLRNESREYANFPLVDRYIGSGPHVREGSPASNAAAIKAPVLLIHGDRDLNVRVGQSRLMADRLRAAGRTIDYVEFKGLDHQLDDSAVRAELLDRADTFLRTKLKP